MSGVTLHRLLYRSDAYLSGSAAVVEERVAEIVEFAARRNAEAGITGALAFTSGTFIQALEGPLDVLEATFERICCDLRHRHLRLLEMSIANERAFGEWAMAWAHPQVDIGRLCEGVRLESGARLAEVSASQAIRLMRVSLLTGSLEGSTPLQQRTPDMW